MEIYSGSVEDLIFDTKDRLKGVLLANGANIRAEKIVVTTGTFLRGLIHIGKSKVPGGRLNEAPSQGLSITFNRLGFRMGRLKTGTPPRLDGSTIFWEQLEIMT